MAQTDEDGFYALPYGHKGKAAYYDVEVWDGPPDGTPHDTGSIRLATTNTMNPDHSIPLQSGGYAEQNFSNDGPMCGGAWTVEDYVITKGKFKTTP